VPDRRTVLAVAGFAAPVLGGAIVLIEGVWVFPLSAALCIAFGHLMTLRASAGRRVPLTLAVLAAISLLASSTPAGIVAAGLIGIPAGLLLVGLVHGDRAAAGMRASEPAGFAAFLAVLVPVEVLVSFGDGVAARALHLVVVVAAAFAWHVAGAAAAALSNERRRWMSARLLFRRSVVEWQPPVVLLVAGAMYSEAHPIVGWWAAVIAALPYLFSHVSLVRLEAVRSTYRQTIRALGRLPEAGGFTVPGHAARTADLAVATGAEMGLGAAESERLEHAAFLHDLGRVVLADRSLTAAGYSDQDVAAWSAAIVGESHYLAPVAEVIAAHPRPYRSHGQRRDPSVPRAARVLRTASAFDEAVAGGLDPLDALEELYLGAAYDHDPTVVTSLRRVLERRGVLPS